MNRVRIPLYVRKWFGEQAIYFVFTLKGVPHARPLPIEGLVDTGSPWLAITPKDYKNLNIPIKALSLAKENVDVRFVGHNFKRLLVENVEIRFLDAKGNPIGVKMPYVSILVPTKPFEGEDTIPSVVGWILSDLVVSHFITII